MNIWSIDGVSWTIPCQIERKAEVTASEISGLMMDKTYFNDVIGTFMRYDVAIAVPQGMESQYYEIYELLTHPVGYHTFVLPYNGDTVTFIGRVEDVSDEWTLNNGSNWWKGVRFTAISNSPTKTVDATELVNYGLSPFPDTNTAIIGEVYQLTETGWINQHFENADVKYY